MRRIKLNMSVLRGRGAARTLAGDAAARLFGSSAAPTISRRDLLKATGAAFTVLSPGVGALGAALRGYRVDVRETSAGPKPGPWRSLCRRSGTYKFMNEPAAPALNIVDEGIIDVAAGESRCGKSKGEEPDLKLHESMFRWSGWSLAVPRPHCAAAPLSQSSGKVAENSFRFVAEFGLAQGEDKLLPRLRFGNRYQLRVRTVDLAGNSLAPEEAADNDEGGRDLRKVRARKAAFGAAARAVR